MPEFEFTLVLKEVGTDLDEADRIYGACPDVSIFGQSVGVPFADMTVQAKSLAAAIAKGIKQVEKAGLTVARVEPDELVNIPEIARRAGRTKQSIDLYFRGLRGPGDFPAPVTNVGKQPVFRWPEVAQWLAAREIIEPAEVTNARTIAAANAAIQLATNTARPLADVWGFVEPAGKVAARAKGA